MVDEVELESLSISAQKSPVSLGRGRYSQPALGRGDVVSQKTTEQAALNRLNRENFLQ